MAIKRPDIYKHNNDTLPIVDISDTWGGMFIMTGSSETERFNIPQTKLKESQLVKNTSGELWELSDISEHDNVNGWTLFASTSGLTGDTYVINASADTDTLYLVRNDGVTITTPLSPAMSGAVLYTNSAATYVDVGGIEDGSTFSAVTMQDMWTDLLYPNLNPSFSYFRMDGQSSISLDVGETLSAGTKVWTWDTINDNFILPDTVKILDISGGIILDSGLPFTADTATVATPTNITKTVRSSHKWGIYAQKYNNMWFPRFLWASWYWRNYWGGSTNPSLNATEIPTLSDNLKTDIFNLDFSFSANSSYKYIIIPVVSGTRPIANNPHHYWYGKRPDKIQDASTNLNIALAGVSDGYTDNVNDAVLSSSYPTTINNLPCKLMTVNNQFGYPIECYVFRSKYMLGGSITIKVD